MTKRKCFIILTFMFGMATAEIIKLECTTPKSEKGVCIKIHDCPIWRALVNQTSDLSNVNFLQKWLCGYKDKIPVVCCPLVQPENTCGKRHISFIDKSVTAKYSSRILRGKKAKLGYWPWMASLIIQITNPSNFKLVQKLCGGTLISSQHVLTAAHCVENKNINLNLTFVRLGDLDLNNYVEDKASPLDFLIQSITLHPKYNSKLVINDIALIRLRDRVSFTELIQPICLPIESSIKDADLTGKLLTVAGWGSTQVNPNHTEPVNSALMEIEVPVWSTEKCKKVWSTYGGLIDERVLCTGFENEGKDPCYGDSGGPLMLENRNQYFLMGIVSFGSCGKPGIPAVYTKVPYFLDWVLETKKKI